VRTAIARREFRLSQEDIEDLLQDLALALLNDSGRQLRAYRQEASLAPGCAPSGTTAAWISSAADLFAARLCPFSRPFR
jgi:hypothetical protein